MSKLVKIMLKDIRFFAHHGVYENEKIEGQYFSINLEMECVLDKVFESDLIKDTIDYEHIYNIVKDIVLSYSYNLLETIADKIISELLLIPKIKSIFVEVRKMNPPIEGSEISYVAVSLYESKSS